MIRFENLKLKDRLIFSVGVMAATMILIVGLGYHISSSAHERLNSLYETTNAKTISAVGLSEAYSKDLVTLVHKLTLGTFPWELGSGRLEEIKDNIRTNLQTLHRNLLDSDEKYLIRDLEGKTEAADAFMAQLTAVIQKRDGHTLLALNRKLYPLVEPVSYRVRLFLNYELGRSRHLALENKAAFHTSYYGWMGLLTLFCILSISLLVAAHLQRTVSTPLNQLVDRMKDIARGEGDLTKRLEVLGKDEIGEVAEAFNTFVGKLQTIGDMKLDLISVVSHQLKTPVAEINGYIENMLEGVTGDLNTKQKRYLVDMKMIGLDNYRLISDLLSVSKIERGVVSVNLKPVSVKRIIELSIRDYEDSIHQKGLSLVLEGLENDFNFFADQDKTVESIRNVVNNAIKCTDKGGISIRVGSQGDDGVIEVQDTGIGMSDEILKRLFTKSRVLGMEAGRAGAGLGLFIAKNFMKLQNGDIGVTSEVGKGTCFRLILPRLTQPEGAPT